MYNVMFESPRMEKGFFEMLPRKTETGGLLFIDSEPVIGGRRIFQRALHVRRAPFFIRSFIVTNNAAKTPDNSYCPEDWKMMQGIAHFTSGTGFMRAISWHSHPEGSDVTPSINDWNNWWQLWKYAKNWAQGAVVCPNPQKLRLYDFSAIPANNNATLELHNVSMGYFYSWTDPLFTDIRKLYKQNKVN